MSRMPYRISEKAINDLEQIWGYTYRKWSEEQADRYYNQIISEIDFIAENFYSGKTIDYIKEGYRVSSVKSHYIFYKMSSDDTVEIIRILHQSMDPENTVND